MNAILEKVREAFRARTRTADEQFAAIVIDAMTEKAEPDDIVARCESLGKTADDLAAAIVCEQRRQLLRGKIGRLPSLEKEQQRVEKLVAKLTGELDQIYADFVGKRDALGELRQSLQQLETEIFEVGQAKTSLLEGDPSDRERDLQRQLDEALRTLNERGQFDDSAPATVAQREGSQSRVDKLRGELEELRAAKLVAAG